MVEVDFGITSAISQLVVIAGLAAIVWNSSKKLNDMENASKLLDFRIGQVLEKLNDMKERIKKLENEGE